jgi:hypothetical protein
MKDRIQEQDTGYSFDLSETISGRCLELSGGYDQPNGLLESKKFLYRLRY